MKLVDGLLYTGMVVGAVVGAERFNHAGDLHHEAIQAIEDAPEVHNKNTGHILLDFSKADRLGEVSDNSYDASAAGIALLGLSGAAIALKKGFES